MNLSKKIKIKKELKLKGIKMSEDMIELSENTYHGWRKEVGMSLAEFIVYRKKEDEAMNTKILGTISLIVIIAFIVAMYSVW